MFYNASSTKTGGTAISNERGIDVCKQFNDIPVPSVLFFTILKHEVFRFRLGKKRELWLKDGLCAPLPPPIRSNT